MSNREGFLRNLLARVIFGELEKAHAVLDGVFKMPAAVLTPQAVDLLAGWKSPTEFGSRAFLGLDVDLKRALLSELGAYVRDTRFVYMGSDTRFEIKKGTMVRLVDTVCQEIMGANRNLPLPLLTVPSEYHPGGAYRYGDGSAVSVPPHLIPDDEGKTPQERIVARVVSSFFSDSRMFEELGCEDVDPVLHGMVQSLRPGEGILLSATHVAHNLEGSFHTEASIMEALKSEFVESGPCPFDGVSVWTSCEAEQPNQLASDVLGRVMCGDVLLVRADTEGKE